MDRSNPESPHATSPIGQMSQLPPAMVSSTSDLGSAVSMSISNPSIPSVISEASSVDLVDTVRPVEPEEKADHMSSGDTVISKQLQELHDDGYTPDDDHDENAFDSDGSDAYDDSSDSDGGLVMTARRRSSAKATTATVDEELNNNTSSNGKEKRAMGLLMRSKKSSRSESSNTMKKVRTHDGEEEHKDHPQEESHEAPLEAQVQQE